MADTSDTTSPVSSKPYSKASVEKELEDLIRKKMQHIPAIAQNGKLIKIRHLRFPPEHDTTRMSLSLLTFEIPHWQRPGLRREGRLKKRRAENFLVRYARPRTEKDLEAVQYAMQTEYAALEYIRGTINRPDKAKATIQSIPVPVPTVLAYNMEDTKDSMNGKVQVVYGPYLLMKIDSSSISLEPLLVGDETQSDIPPGTPLIWEAGTSPGDQPPRALTKVVKELARHQFRLYSKRSRKSNSPFLSESNFIGGIGITSRMVGPDSETKFVSLVGRFELPIRLDPTSEFVKEIENIPKLLHNNWPHWHFRSIWDWFAFRLDAVKRSLELLVHRNPESDTGVSPGLDDNGSGSVVDLVEKLIELASEVSTLEEKKLYTNPVDRTSGSTFLQPGCEFDSGSLLVDAESEEYSLVAIVDWQGAEMVPVWRVGMPVKMFRGPTIHDGHIEELKDSGSVYPPETPSLNRTDTTINNLGLMHRKYQLRMIYNKSMESEYTSAFSTIRSTTSTTINSSITRLSETELVERKRLDSQFTRLKKTWYMYSGHAYIRVPRSLREHPGDVHQWETWMLGRDFDILLMALEGPGGNDPDGYLRGFQSKADPGIRKHVTQWLGVFEAYLEEKQSIIMRHESSKLILPKELAKAVLTDTRKLKIDERYAPFTARIFFAQEASGYRNHTYSDMGLTGELVGMKELLFQRGEVVIGYDYTLEDVIKMIERLPWCSRRFKLDVETDYADAYGSTDYADAYGSTGGTAGRKT